MFKEIVNPSEALHMGTSGWIGFDMFKEYADLVSGRNSSIYSRSVASKRSLPVPSSDNTRSTKEAKFGDSGLGIQVDVNSPSITESFAPSDTDSA